MKSNLYLKIVLTIIAINLTLLTIKELHLIPTANASASLPKREMPAANYGFVPINEDGSINVRIKNSDVLDVQIRGINRGLMFSWDAIRTR